MLLRATSLMVVAVSLGLMPGLLLAQDAPAQPAPTEYLPDSSGGAAAPSADAAGQAPATPGEDAGDGSPTATEDAPPQPFNPMFLFVMIGIFVLMYFIMGRSRRKQEAKRKEMLSSLKKGDKVTTIGGQIGTIMDVREDEVVVKVDESNNIRVRFARWAVRGVGEEGRAESDDQKK
jgi:preprotein translocase subunit YajC